MIAQSGHKPYMMIGQPYFSPNANLGNQAATPCRMTFFPKPYWEMLLPVNLYQRENEGRGTKAHVSKK